MISPHQKEWNLFALEKESLCIVGVKLFAVSTTYANRSKQVFLDSYNSLLNRSDHM